MRINESDVQTFCKDWIAARQNMYLDGHQDTMRKVLTRACINVFAAGDTSAPCGPWLQNIARAEIVKIQRAA